MAWHQHPTLALAESLQTSLAHVLATLSRVICNCKCLRATSRISTLVDGPISRGLGNVCHFRSRNLKHAASPASELHGWASGCQCSAESRYSTRADSRWPFVPPGQRWHVSPIDLQSLAIGSTGETSLAASNISRDKNSSPSKVPDAQFPAFKKAQHACHMDMKERKKSRQVEPGKVFQSPTLGRKKNYMYMYDIQS
ncbi:hypothetical protein F5Y09DRAFT_344375 [Xylaria sp. FL1042]|nr:hypothetical protein F5Y09DRAFT_344375 [Xylaria sp. FL1042]